ncbi:MAG TPA: hypothetical protein PLU47_15600 [Azonexus sp.]|nr:hypothetical protein [Azonexus sp.]
MNIDVTNQPAISRGAEIMNAAIEHCGSQEVIKIFREQINAVVRNRNKPSVEKIKINRTGDTALDAVVSAEKIRVNPFEESFHELVGMTLSLVEHLYRLKSAARTESAQIPEIEKE